MVSKYLIFIPFRHLRAVKPISIPVLMIIFYSPIYSCLTGRRRAVTICNYLLDSLCVKPPMTNDAYSNESNMFKVPSYDTKGLFLTSTTQLLNEQCSQTKTKLEELLKTIIFISRVRAKQDGKNCEVFDLIFEWCNSKTLMCRSIGFKLMTLYLPLELSDEKLKSLSQPILDIFKQAVNYLEEIENENSSPILAYLIANILQSLKLLLVLTNNSKLAIHAPVREFIFGAVVKSEKVNSLIVHENVIVRKQTLELFEEIFQNRLELLANVINSDQIETSSTKSKKRRKSNKRDDRYNVPVDILKNVLINICELGKFDVREESLLINNLTLIYDMCEIDPNISKRTSTETEDIEYLCAAYVYKKARSIFIHEKFHINNETSRRILFYNFVHKFLKNINGNKKEKHSVENKLTMERSLSAEVKSLVLKHLTKDRRQAYLEEIIVQIEKEVQDLSAE